MVLRAHPDAAPSARFDLIDTGIVEAYTDRLGDVDGDGVADLLLCNLDETWSVHLWSPTTAHGPGFDPNGIPIPALAGTSCSAINDKELRVVDLDGDGKAEIVVPDAAYYTDPFVLWGPDGSVYCGGRACHYRAFSLDGATWSETETDLLVHTMSDAGGTGSTQGITGSSIGYDQSQLVGETIFVDVNGDGLPDAVRTGYGDGRPRTFMNTGAGFADQGVPSFHGAPLPDGHREDRYAHFATLIDYDGDGRTDLLVPMPYGCEDPQDSSACWVVWRSEGDGTFTVRKTGIYFPEDVANSDSPDVAQNARVLVGGDGRHDVVALASPDGSFAFERHENDDGPQDLLLTVTGGMNALDSGDDGFLPDVSITYGSLVDEATTKRLPPSSSERESMTYLPRSDTGSGCDYPVACVVGPQRVVARYAQNDGANRPRTFHVRYRDGRFHRLGRGFLGFGARIVEDGDTRAGTAELYDNATYDPTLRTFPFAGQVVRSWAFTPALPGQPDPTQIELGYTRTMLQEVPTYRGKTYFAMPVIAYAERDEGSWHAIAGGETLLEYVEASEVSPEHVLSHATTVVQDYDDLGDVLSESRTTDGVDLRFDTTRTFSNDPDTWLVGLPASEVACSTALAVTQCRTTVIDRDAHTGDVTSVWTGDPDDPATQVTTTYRYDVFGHAVSTRADDTAGHHRSSCVSYEPEGVFPYAARNPAGHLSFTRFDRGLGVAVAAEDPNGLVTQWQHDRLGRVTKELPPDGGATTMQLARNKKGGPEGKWWRVEQTTTTDGLGERTTELDSLGRTVRVSTRGPDVLSCGKSLCSDAPWYEERTEYDHLGRVARASLPWLSGDAPAPELYHRFAYDAAGRVVEHTTPWNGKTVYAYQGNHTSITDSGGTASVDADTLGRPADVTDKTGNVTHTAYGPFGAVWSVTRQGGETTLSERDAYGRVLREFDPDRGETDVRYDGFGQPIGVDDAFVNGVAGRHHAFTYDALGRLVQRDDPDGTTTWEYDTASHGIGRIAVVTSPAGHTLQHTYDPFSQPATVVLGIDGETFQTTYTYDGFGRLQTIAYPQGPGVSPLLVRRGYDARGYLTSVRDNASGTPFWRLDGVDGAGRPALETFGNGVTTHSEHDPEKGTATRLLTANAGGDALQDLRYGYDDRLNLTSRADALQAVAGGIRTEVFHYDALDRLTCAGFGVEPLSGAKPPFTPAGGVHATPACGLWIAYAPNGNIASKSDVGAYTYDPTHPHQVKTAGFASYGYDAAGNQNARPGALAIDYTAFDLPSQMVFASGDYSFDYDGDQQRIRKTTPEGETVYVGDLYERVTSGGLTQHRYYVAAGSATVVIARAAGQADDVAYVHPDALGSPDVLTDGAGAVVERRSYDPFGARRSPAWGQHGAGPFPPSKTTIGFTGQEDDEALGLVNMKGRIYDPVVGRFLQTDPLVSHPLFSQSWNPYSYVLNNPLSFVDPSGFDPTIQVPPVHIVGQRPPIEEQLDLVIGMCAMGRCPEAPASPTPPAPDPNWVSARDAGRDDVVDTGVAHTPQAVAQGSPFALDTAELVQGAGPGKAYAVTLAADYLNALPTTTLNTFTEGALGGAMLGKAIGTGLARDGIGGGVDAAVHGLPVVGPALALRDMYWAHDWNLATPEDKAVALAHATPVAAALLVDVALVTGLAGGESCPGCADGVCFVAGTGVLTPTGVRAIESLGPGDLVVTRGAGFAASSWRAASATCVDEPDAEASDRAFDGKARVPSLDDVVWVLAGGGAPAEHEPLAAVRADARAAFQGQVYETRRSGGQVEIRATGEVLERVRQAIRRGTDRLVELTVRTAYGEHRVVGTPEHLFYVPERRGFLPMGKLTAGAALLSQGGEVAEVVHVEERPASSEVFNIQIEGTHTYLVCGGLDAGCELVHNACPLRPEAKLEGSGKHGVYWKEALARARNTGKAQGQWGAKDLPYATEKANGLKPGESGWFDLPSDSTSVVVKPDGATVRATRFWVRNNGTGTWHGYPAE